MSREDAKPRVSHHTCAAYDLPSITDGPEPIDYLVEEGAIDATPTSADCSAVRGSASRARLNSSKWSVSSALCSLSVRNAFGGKPVWSASRSTAVATGGVAFQHRDVPISATGWAHAEVLDIGGHQDEASPLVRQAIALLESKGNTAAAARARSRLPDHREP